MADSEPHRNVENLDAGTTGDKTDPRLSVEATGLTSETDTTSEANSRLARLATTDVDRELDSRGSLTIADAATEHSGWTVAVDLAANLQPDGTNLVLGAEPKSEQLKTLAQQTAGTDISIIVQAVSTDGNLERYIMRDGSMEQIYSGRSEGMQQNLQALLSDAQRYAPSDHLGLIIQSHGAAGNGLATGRPGRENQLSLEQLNSTVQQALQQSGRDKLDLLNFDSCIMGSYSVLDSVSGLASHVVASEETEAGCTPLVDGQDLASTLSRALTDKDLTADELAQYFIDDARRGEITLSQEKPGELCTAVPTLASFDTSKVTDFQSALNALGVGLSQLPEQARDELDKAIESAAVEFSNRDLGKFLTSLEQSVNSGAIADPQGALGEAIDVTRDTMADLVTDFNGQGANYRDMGGLSVYLPEPDTLRVTDERVNSSIKATLTLLQRLMTESNERNSAPTRPEQQLQGTAQRVLDDFRASTPLERQSELDFLERAVDRADDPQEGTLSERASLVYREMQRLLESDLGAGYREYLQKRMQTLKDQEIDRSVPDAYEGWQGFITSLAA